MDPQQPQITPEAMKAAVLLNAQRTGRAQPYLPVPGTKIDDYPDGSGWSVKDQFSQLPAPATAGPAAPAAGPAIINGGHQVLAAGQQPLPDSAVAAAIGGAGSSVNDASAWTKQLDGSYRPAPGAASFAAAPPANPLEAQFQAFMQAHGTPYMPEGMGSLASDPSTGMAIPGAIGTDQRAALQNAAIDRQNMDAFRGLAGVGADQARLGIEQAAEARLGVQGQADIAVRQKEAEARIGALGTDKAIENALIQRDAARGATPRAMVQHIVDAKAQLRPGVAGAAGGVGLAGGAGGAAPERPGYGSPDSDNAQVLREATFPAGPNGEPTQQARSIEDTVLALEAAHPGFASSSPQNFADLHAHLVNTYGTQAAEDLYNTNHLYLPGLFGKPSAKVQASGILKNAAQKHTGQPQSRTTFLGLPMGFPGYEAQ